MDVTRAMSSMRARRRRIADARQAVAAAGALDGCARRVGR
jgi:hypothetical protein